MTIATLDLSEEEIRSAIAAEAEKNGWRVVGNVALIIHPGCDDQRDYVAPRVTAKVQVTR